MGRKKKIREELEEDTEDEDMDDEDEEPEEDDGEEEELEVPKPPTTKPLNKKEFEEVQTKGIKKYRTAEVAVQTQTVIVNNTTGENMDIMGALVKILNELHNLKNKID